MSFILTVMNDTRKTGRTRRNLLMLLMEALDYHELLFDFGTTEQGMVNIHLCGVLGLSGVHWLF